jgi:uncharacterized protein (TIRG00374 family)
VAAAVRIRRSVWLAAAVLALGLGIPLAYGGAGLFGRLAAFSPLLLGAVLGMVFTGWNFNAGRLRLMLGGIRQPMSHGRALATVMATEFAFSATPAGSGGPLAYVYLLRRHGVTGSTAAALYALDVLMDMLFFAALLVIIALALLFRPEALHAGWQIGLLAALLLAVLAGAWLALRHYRPLLLGGGRLLRRLKIPPATRRRIARGLLRFRQGLGVMLRLSRGRLVAIYLLCIGHWLLRYSILYVLIRGLGESVPWAYTLLVQMLALTLGQFTLLPGGSGGVELGFTALLAPLLDPPTLGAVLLLWRFATYYWCLLAGAPVFAGVAGRTLWERLAPRSARATGGEEPGTQPL